MSDESGRSEEFDQLMAAADPPLVVLTTAAAGDRSGCLVGFHSQTSITPQRYAFWLSKANHTYKVALRADRFALHFLTDADLAVAEHFGTASGEDTDKFADIDVDDGPGGVPLLASCPHRLVLERISMLDDGGDHVCVTTRVLSAHTAGAFVPLRVSAASQLEPGHDSDERVIQP